MQVRTLILSAVMAVSLMACGGGGASPAGASSPNTNNSSPASSAGANGQSMPSDSNSATTSTTIGSATTSTVASTTSTTAAAASTLRWSVTNLGAFNEDEQSVAAGINNVGQIVGNTKRDGEFFHRPFVYANGTMQAMLTPQQEASIQPGLINNSGMVAGYTYQPQAQDGGGPFVYAQGSYARLGSGRGAFGINDDGKTVGNLTTQTYHPDAPEGSSPFTYRRSAFLYFNGGMTDLTAEMGALFAYGINAQGDIVGGLADGSAYLYRSSQTSRLGTLAGDTHSLALSINATGEIVGISSNQDNIGEFDLRFGSSPVSGWRAFVVKNGTMTDLNAAGSFTASHAFYINNQGHILGEANKDGTTFSYLYRNGSFINLNALTELQAAGWSDVRFYGMNDADQIVGKGVIGGKVRALLLTPGSGG